jgi:hypothetical protein
MDQVILGKIYKHHKGGRYFVLHIVDESTNANVGRKGVVYLSLTRGLLKHRDLEEFVEIIEWPDGQKRPRFVLDTDPIPTINI